MAFTILSHMRSSPVIRRVGAFLKQRVVVSDALKVYYLRLARFLSTHGIDPPLTIPAERWEKRWSEQATLGAEDGPELYRSCDDSTEKLFQEVLPLLDKNSAILEIGCNKGRHLNYLFQKGFRNLTGIEIGKSAIELFAEIFPDTYQNSTIIVGSDPDEIRKLKTKSFDLVFVHSVLVSIGTKHNYIFSEMCRICRGYILTLESEGSWTAFPRDFQYMFEKNGFNMVSYRWLVWTDDKKSLTFPLPVNSKSFLENNTIRLFAPRVSESGTKLFRFQQNVSRY